MSTDGLMGEQEGLIHTRELLVSLKNEGNSDTCHNLANLANIILNKRRLTQRANAWFHAEEEQPNPQRQQGEQDL